MTQEVPAGGRFRMAAGRVVVGLLAVLALAAGVPGLPGLASGQEPPTEPPAGSVEIPGWKIGVVNTADAHGEILPCT